MKSVLCAVAVVVAGPGVAAADDYGKWAKDEAKKTYTCDYNYTTKAGTPAKQTVVVYYDDKDRAGWAYYYNAKSEPWARCAVAGNPKYNDKVMYWEHLKADATGYEAFADKDGKPQVAGYCPTVKDAKAAIPTLPLPPK